MSLFSRLVVEKESILLFIFNHTVLQFFVVSANFTIFLKRHIIGIKACLNVCTFNSCSLGIKWSAFMSTRSHGVIGI